jgi:hypothetical protein
MVILYCSILLHITYLFLLVLKSKLHVRWLTNRNNFITVAFVELLIYPKYVCRGVCFTYNKCMQGRKQQEIIRVTVNFSQIKENLETNRFRDVQRLLHHIATIKL